jgi:hypothetical protein
MNLRTRDHYFPMEVNRRGVASEAPYHPLSPHTDNLYTPPHEKVELTRSAVSHNTTSPPQLDLHHDPFSFSPEPAWGFTNTPETTRGLVGNSAFVPGSNMGLGLSPGGIPDRLREATRGSMLREQAIPTPVTMQDHITPNSHTAKEEAQCDNPTRMLRRNAAQCSLGAVPNLFPGSAKAGSHHRSCRKREFSRAPGYLRNPLAYLLNIVEQALPVWQGGLEPTIGSELADNILIEVCDKTGVWLGNIVNKGESLYFLFIDKARRVSFICGHSSRTSDRALGHIRSMLGHRPFECLGISHGCSSKKCNSSGTRQVLILKYSANRRELMFPLSPQQNAILYGGLEE